VPTKAANDEDMARIKAEFKLAAERAKRAGFDGIEVHMAYGSLLDCFLRDGTNTRTDKYGGSVENRTRFPMEVMDVVLSVWPP